METNQFLARIPAANYKCWDFVREVWAYNFNEDIGDRLTGIRIRNQLVSFDKLSIPDDICLIVLQRGVTPPHIGIYIRGSVLHLAGNGAELQPLDVVTARYPRVSYYR